MKSKQRINHKSTDNGKRKTKAQAPPVLETPDMDDWDAQYIQIGQNALSPDNILKLQKTIGNQAVQRLISKTSTISSPKITPNAQVKTDSPSAIEDNLSSVHEPVIQRGEASVHEGIEKEATKGIDPQLLKEMYAGNWMRDHSQLNLPMPHSLLKNLPKNLDDPHGDKIGAEGSEDIITSVIRALAFMHFGPEITNDLITPENIGAYTPEQHVDNPMGTTAEDHLVRDSESGLMRTGTDDKVVEEDSAQVIKQDTDTHEALAGSAFPGLQVGNPALFEVSDAGLGNHIYNAVEWTKGQLWEAVSEGESPKGRMYLGSALHAIEDYFSHSNFIEVALNSEIGRAVNAHKKTGKSPYSSGFLDQTKQQRSENPQGAFVDTMYDAKTDDGRMAVTTTTAGSKDLQVSLGQMVLPHIPDLAQKINTKIDEAFNLVVKSNGKTSWEKIKEHFEKDANGLAVLEVVTALDKHISLTAYDFRLTGRDIPLTNRFIPTGYDTSTSTKGVVEAVQHYIRLYKRINGYFEDFNAIIGILIPSRFLKELKEKFVEYMQQFRDDVKARINEFLLGLVEKIIDKDLSKEKKKGIQYALNVGADYGVEHIRHTTSIESQLADMSDEEKAKMSDEEKYMKYGIVGDKPQFALPPSHSEISKDHAPHDHDALKGKYDVSEGSLFYKLHHNLAVEADKHIIKQMQAVWDEQNGQNSVDSLNTSPTVNADQVLHEASNHQKLEQLRAQKEGRTLNTYEGAGQSVSDLMSLVDFFIAHPDDTSWWQPIMSSYVSANEDQVITHIMERNKTRDKRGTKEESEHAH